MASPQADGQIGNEVVRRLAGSVGDEYAPSVAEGLAGSVGPSVYRQPGAVRLHFPAHGIDSRRNRLGDAPDLVDLQQQRRACIFLLGEIDPLDVRRQEIISYQLDRTHFLERLPRLPVILGEGVFQQYNGVVFDQGKIQSFKLLFREQLWLLRLESQVILVILENSDEAGSMAKLTLPSWPAFRTARVKRSKASVGCEIGGANPPSSPIPMAAPTLYQDLLRHNLGKERRVDLPDDPGLTG